MEGMISKNCRASESGLGRAARKNGCAEAKQLRTADRCRGEPIRGGVPGGPTSGRGALLWGSGGNSIVDFGEPTELYVNKPHPNSTLSDSHKTWRYLFHRDFEDVVHDRLEQRQTEDETGGGVGLSERKRTANDAKGRKKTDSAGGLCLVLEANCHYRE